MWVMIGSNSNSNSTGNAGDFIRSNKEEIYRLYVEMQREVRKHGGGTQHTEHSRTLSTKMLELCNNDEGFTQKIISFFPSFFFLSFFTFSSTQLNSCGVQKWRIDG